MYNVACNTDTSSGTCKASLVNAFCFAALGHVMEEWAVKHHLYMGVRETEELLNPGTVLERDGMMLCEEIYLAKSLVP